MSQLEASVTCLSYNKSTKSWHIHVLYNLLHDLFCSQNYYTQRWHTYAITEHIEVSGALA